MKEHKFINVTEGIGKGDRVLVEFYTYNISDTCVIEGEILHVDRRTGLYTSPSIQVVSHRIISNNIKGNLGSLCSIKDDVIVFYLKHGDVLSVVHTRIKKIKELLEKQEDRKYAVV